MGLLLNVAATGGAAAQARGRPRLRAIEGGRDAEGRDRGRRDGRARRAGARRRRRAAGLAAPRSSSSAASGPRPSSCRPPGTRSTALQRRGARPPQPAEGRARAAGSPRGAAARARRLLREIGADAVMGGGGYVAGPVGLAAADAAAAARADRGRLPPGHRQPAAGAARRGACSSRSRSPGATASATGHRPADPAGHRGADRDAARARASGSPRRRACVLVFGGSLGARRLNEAAVEAFGDAPPRATSCTPAAGATTTTCAPGSTRSGRRRTTTCTPTSSRSPTRSPRPTWPWRAPAARCSSSPRPGCPSILVPYPHATADHQTGNARWMEDAGAAVVVPDAELDGPRLAREVAALLGAPQRGSAMAEAAGAWRARTRPSGSPTGSSSWSRARRARRCPAQGAICAPDRGQRR